MQLEERWRKRDKESCKRSYLQIMKWFKNFTTSTQLIKKHGINTIKTKPTSKKQSNFSKNKLVFDKKLERCTTIKRTTSKTPSSTNKKNTTSTSPPNSSRSSTKKDATKASTSNATPATRSSPRSDSAPPSSSSPNRSLPSTTEECPRCRRDGQRLPTL